MTKPFGKIDLRVMNYLISRSVDGKRVEVRRNGNLLNYNNKFKNMKQAVEWLKANKTELDKAIKN